MLTGGAGKLASKFIPDKVKHAVGDKVASLFNKPCSFSADTLVMTQEGLKPIVEIREADIVLARDEQTGKNVWRKVIGAMSKMHESVLVLDIEIEAGVSSQIITTEEHPFYIKGKGWAEAGTLKSGILLETAEGFVKLTGMSPVAKQQLAYDLTVEGAHTFFVGEPQVLVHNCGDKLPDDAIVCRGGSCEADRFANGSGVTTDADGNLGGVSVNSAPDKSLGELTQGIPHNKVGVTTVGDVRKAGGDVVASPTRNNPNHATMSGVRAEQAQELMTPTVRNPSK